jgi:hypothetical protein
MKSILTIVLMFLMCSFVAAPSGGPCGVTDPTIELNSVTPDGENCIVDLTVTFKIFKNNGNKFTYIHFWRPDEYPSPAYKKGPDADELGKVLATIAIDTDGEVSLLSEYKPDESIVPLFDGLSVSEINEGDSNYEITVEHVRFVVPGACTDVPHLEADVWSTQAAAKNSPVHCVNALPVELAKFRGDRMGDGISLSWITTEEISSNYFEIERSADLSEFTTLSKVQSNGTSKVTQHYNFTDHSPLAGNNYYRLKMVDVDGSFETSKIINVENHANSVAFALLGNPVINREIKFILSNASASNINLYDLTGRKLNFTVTSVGNNYTIKLTENVASGLYLLSLRGNGAAENTKKILIP